jgi:soluble lytic murein transglycosylase
VRDAVDIVAPDADALLAQATSDPARFLREKALALTRQRKEFITLALIRLASSEPAAAAEQLSKKWGVQLTAEERNWVWGVIGRRTAMRLDPQALAHYGQVSRDADLSDDMLAWKVRAALRAGTQPQWPQVLAAVSAMSEGAARDPAWVYWRAKALMASDAPAAAVPAPAGLHAGPLSSAPGSTAAAVSPFVVAASQARAARASAALAGDAAVTLAHLRRLAPLALRHRLRSDGPERAGTA